MHGWVFVSPHNAQLVYRTGHLSVSILIQYMPNNNDGYFVPHLHPVNFSHFDKEILSFFIMCISRNVHGTSVHQFKLSISEDKQAMTLCLGLLGHVGSVSVAPECADALSSYDYA